MSFDETVSVSPHLPLKSCFGHIYVGYWFRWVFCFSHFFCRHNYVYKAHPVVLQFWPTDMWKTWPGSLKALLSFHCLKLYPAKQTWNAEMTGWRSCTKLYTVSSKISLGAMFLAPSVPHLPEILKCIGTNLWCSQFEGLCSAASVYCVCCLHPSLLFTETMGKVNAPRCLTSLPCPGYYMADGYCLNIHCLEADVCHCIQPGEKGGVYDNPKFVHWGSRSFIRSERSPESRYVTIFII